MLATLIIAALLVLVVTALAPPVIFPGKEAKSYLIAYWNFDEASGNRGDSIGSLTITNLPLATTSSVGGKVGNAAKYDGGGVSAGLWNGQKTGSFDSPQALEMTNQTYSVAGWFWIPDDNMGQEPPYGLMGKAAESQGMDWWLTCDADNKVTFHHNGNDGFNNRIEYGVSSSAAVISNDWNFVVATYSTNTTKLAISLNSSAFVESSAGVPSNWTTTNAPLGMGSIDSITWLTLANGYQDETGVWVGYALNFADAQFLNTGKTWNLLAPIRPNVGRFW